ncbi:PucR family transcriptional regulator [Modestobacter sp. NPDC049651]|uniref:PucR family transcriptional regulator n=1 Tax=unclassified Modestobacter TaxID=2643866 RepID=UPI0033F6618E
MGLTVAEMLDDPFVAATDPLVVTGGADLSRTVRWVHASEQLDIAPLLLGGEVVLMEGVNLGAGLTDAECRSYVSSLVEAGVAGLAVELTDRLPAVPPAVVAAADEAGLPVVAMRRRVPFVQICQSVNTRLSDGSLRQLRLADRLSVSLADLAGGSATVTPLLEVIARETRADVTLVGLDGGEIARAGLPDDPAGDRPDDTAFAGSFSAPLRAGQAVCGTLLLRARAEADIHSVAVALDRAPEVLAISLLRVRPPSIEERLTAELFALLSRDGRDRSADALQVEVYLDRLGLPADAHYLGVSADIGGDWHRLRAVREVVRRVAPGALVQVAGDELLAVLPFAVPAELERARAVLLADLPRPARPRGTAVACVGAGTRRRRDLAREVTAVRTVRRWSRRPAADEGVVDARGHAVERLVRSLDDDPRLGDFVDEVLGRLTEGGGDLLHTLAAYGALWGSKTATAAALGIGRQTLYQRLDRIEALVGPLDATPARAAAVLTAAFVEEARRSLPAHP